MAHLKLPTNDSQNSYTEAELEEYKSVFRVFDQDGSGAIGNTELGEAMKSLGLQTTDKELKKLIAEVDVDGNGEIDFDEFCMCMKRLTVKKQSDEELIKQCFQIFDQDYNGFVSEPEFRRICVEIGSFTDQMADELFREADVDSNGRLDYNEFEQIVKTYLLDDNEGSDHEQ